MHIHKKRIIKIHTHVGAMKAPDARRVLIGVPVVAKCIITGVALYDVVLFNRSHNFFGCVLNGIVIQIILGGKRRNQKARQKETSQTNVFHGNLYLMCPRNDRNNHASKVLTLQLKNG